MGRHECFEIHTEVVKRPKVGYEPIVFKEEDELGVEQPHDDPLVIEAEVANYTVKRVFVDDGSSANVIFLPSFEEMGIPHAELSNPTTLHGFTGHSVTSYGSLRLPLSVGRSPESLQS